MESSQGKTLFVPNVSQLSNLFLQKTKSQGFEIGHILREARKWLRFLIRLNNLNNTYSSFTFNFGIMASTIFFAAASMDSSSVFISISAYSGAS